LEQAKKAYETQELTHDTLISIKNKFIELIPDASLLPDMFRVVRAQSFVLSIINNVLAGKQLELGGNFEEGTKYFEDKIKQMKGGAGQSGGVFLQSLIPTANIPVHGAAFYDHDHNNPAQVWNTNLANGAVDYLAPAAGAGQNINILTLPYGVRRITQDYVDRMNSAILDLDRDKIVYIPILDIRKISNSQMEIIILTATYIANTAVLRITGQMRMRLNQDGRKYQQIQGDYYLYNILENSTVANGRSNLKRLLENGQFIKISGTHIILPVFYRFNVVDNQLFNYFEYALLHPFLGGIMSATLRESDLKRTVAGDVGGNAALAGYDFKDKNNVLVAVNPYELNLRLMLHNDDIDLTDITANNYIYYYNFCGTEIIIKQYTAGTDFFNVQNYSAMGAPDGHAAYTTGNLQPIAGLIDMNTNANKANYANYILQLTGHINELFDKISKTTINMVGRTMTPQFNSGTQNEISLYRFDYMTNTAPATSLRFNADTTELSLLPDKGWTPNYVKNWFIDDVSSHKLVDTFAFIQILLADIIHFIDTKYKMPLLDSAVGDAAKLLEIIYGHSAASAGLTGPGGGLPTAADVFKRVDPKFKKRIEFLRMALPRTGKEGDYWENLDKMTKLIKKFSSQDYVDYSGILFRIYDSMQNIRKFEDKILDIKFKEDKTPKLPEVDLIAKNLETKPPASSKDAYTAAGQKLYDLLKDNKSYIAQNAFVVNTETLVRDLEPFLRQITKISNNNLIMDLELNNFFYTSPGDQFVDVLCTKRGAEKFVKQMKQSEYYKDDATISKICFSVKNLLGITPAKYKDAYDVYNPLAARNKALLQAKKGNRKPRHGNRRKHGGRRG